VGLQFLSGVEGGGVVIKRHRRMEKSARIGPWTFLRQLDGQT